MTGLEKILSQIEYESNDRCRNITEQAKEKANEIIESAKTEAQSIVADSEAETAKRLDNIKQSAQSSAELSKSKIILKSKLEVIDEMLNNSLEKIKALPDKEYFEILSSLIRTNAKEGEGVLKLNDKDSKRLPKDFVSAVNKELTGGKSVVLGDTTDIDSGFILTYGDIDINCSFDAIAASKRDEIRDSLNGLLFD